MPENTDAILYGLFAGMKAAQDRLQDWRNPPRSRDMINRERDAYFDMQADAIGFASRDVK